MNVLSGLKLVSARRTSANSPIEVRRQKLSNKLEEQINLTHALGDGETYSPKHIRRIRDPITGEVTKREVVRRVRPWWFTANTGKVCVQMRYGTRVIEITKGKNSIELAAMSDLVGVLQMLKSAAITGELDAQLETASDGVKARFKKSAKV